jgi:hypothetical protein
MRVIIILVLSVIIYPATGLRAGTVSRPNTLTDSNYFGNARVSYTVHGKKTTIKNILQTDGQNIKALHLNTVILIPKKGLVRVNFTNVLTHEVFDFVVADKGTTVIRHYKPTMITQEEKKAAYMSEQLVNYYADNCTVVISTADDKHVVGKFAGQFIADNGARINIKDGNFDIPMNQTN